MFASRPVGGYLITGKANVGVRTICDPGGITSSRRSERRIFCLCDGEVVQSSTPTLQ